VSSLSFSPPPPCCSDLLSSEVDGKTATYILSTIREEEQQTEMLKRQTATVAAIGAADAIDTSGVAAEQSFNREQVQEQEQVHFATICVSHFATTVEIQRMAWIGAFQCIFLPRPSPCASFEHLLSLSR
jgi:hypothetical protein